MEGGEGRAWMSWRTERSRGSAISEAASTSSSTTPSKVDPIFSAKDSANVSNSARSSLQQAPR